MISWSLLPPEIRLLVFDELLTSEKYYFRAISKCTAYTLVCKEWQDFFEKYLYEWLVVRDTSLDAFSKITGSRRDLVRHICLKIDLEDYDCPDCMTCSRPVRGGKDSRTIADSIHKLFSILSTWSTSRERLVLEIIISSPSDDEHIFKEWGPPAKFDAGEDTECPKSFHDIYHGWSEGRRARPPHAEAISKVLTQSWPDFQLWLPSLRIVKSLLLPRETRRTIHSEPLSHIIRSLPNLEYFRFEPWRGAGRRNVHELVASTFDLTCLPTTLKSLTLFENFNEDYDVVNLMKHPNYLSLAELVGGLHASAAANLAQRSLDLIELSASYLINAVDFFGAAINNPTWIWNNLTSLALTSQSLIPKTDHDWINNLLVDAGKAALRMPQLRTMEIWNGRKGVACVFRYYVAKHQTTITWRGTWELELDDKVIAVWKEVALLYTSNELSEPMYEAINRSGIKSHASAIRQLLVLQNLVIHRVSLSEIEKEAKHYFYDHERYYREFGLPF